MEPVRLPGRVPLAAQVGDPIKLHVRWANGRTTTSPERITRLEHPFHEDGLQQRGCPTSTKARRTPQAGAERRDQWLSQDDGGPTLYETRQDLTGPMVRFAGPARIIDGFERHAQGLKARAEGLTRGKERAGHVPQGEHASSPRRTTVHVSRARGLSRRGRRPNPREARPTYRKRGRGPARELLKGLRQISPASSPAPARADRCGDAAWRSSLAARRSRPRALRSGPRTETPSRVQGSAARRRRRPGGCAAAERTARRSAASQVTGVVDDPPPVEACARRNACRYSLVLFGLALWAMTPTVRGRPGETPHVRRESSASEVDALGPLLREGAPDLDLEAQVDPRQAIRRCYAPGGSGPVGSDHPTDPQVAAGRVHDDALGSSST